MKNLIATGLVVRYLSNPTVQKHCGSRRNLFRCESTRFAGGTVLDIYLKHMPNWIFLWDVAMDAEREIVFV